jgi:hypothetical protein
MSGVPRQFWARAGEDNAQPATSMAKSFISTSSTICEPITQVCVSQVCVSQVCVSHASYDYSVKSRRLIDSSNQTARNRESCPRTIMQSGIYRCAACRCRTRDKVQSKESQGGAPGGFIPWSRDACAIDPQGRQLADIGNARHVCDQLVFYRQGRNRGFNCRYGDHHQNCVVLPSRTRMGVRSLGTALNGFSYHSDKRAVSDRRLLKKKTS